jgi:hypothetical protein
VKEITREVLKDRFKLKTRYEPPKLMTPEWINDQIDKLHTQEDVSVAIRELWAIVLAYVEMNAAEDASCCAFVALKLCATLTFLATGELP